jgi:hypothetical protein
MLAAELFHEVSPPVVDRFVSTSYPRSLSRFANFVNVEP